MSNHTMPHDQQAALDQARADFAARLNRKTVPVEDALREASIALMLAGRGDASGRDVAALAELRQAIDDERDAAVAPIARLHNEARAEIDRLRAELAEEQASRARLDEHFRSVCEQRDTTSRLNEAVRKKLATATRLGLEACGIAIEAYGPASDECPANAIRKELTRV